MAEAHPMHDLESEQAQRHRDLSDKYFRDYQRNLNIGDIADALQEASEDQELCVRILGAVSVTPIDKTVIANNFLDKLDELIRRLADRDADNEMDTA